MKPIETGSIVTDYQVERIVSGISDRTLPKVEWTHGAHLCAGVGFLKREKLARSEEILSSIIPQYNLATGVQNTDEDGYHHTITLFYLREIDHFLAGRWAEPNGHLASAILSSCIAAKPYPLLFYSKDRLFSVEARRNWIDPDLRRLSANSVAT